MNMFSNCLFLLIFLISTISGSEVTDKKRKNNVGVSVSTFGDPFALSYKRYFTEKFSVLTSGYIKYDEDNENDKDLMNFKIGIMVELQRNIPPVKIFTFYPLIGFGWKYKKYEYSDNDYPQYSRQSKQYYVNGSFGLGMEVVFFKRLSFYADFKEVFSYRTYDVNPEFTWDTDFSDFDILYGGGIGIGIIF